MRRRDISSDVSRLRLNHRLNLSRPGFAGVLSYSLREALTRTRLERGEDRYQH